ncbi:hypothetical protein AAFC00_005952 [Neodothiora populina]|uniref:Guanine deaminase n=1 Tax=Neodothiora populina TaxID=2781224 RepID=A0ABR3P7T5_9PEZI
MGLTKTIYVGPFAHCVSLQELDICVDGAIGVDESGKIAFVERDVPTDYEPSKEGWSGAEIIRIGDNGFFFPGFIDTHIHASQYPNAGIFGNSTLLDWLNTYTFPMESSFKDVNFARRVYTRVVSRTLSHGTTTACYYATVHVPATNLLSDICLEKGQRAFVGRVCMDRLSPDYYRDESVESTIADSRACIEHVKKIDPQHALITPVITPRFAPSCTDESLCALGELHKETQFPVQTHISENKAEIELVKELFPKSKHYTDVYDEAGLLTSKTILAHCVHLSKDEQSIIKQRGAKISHCPASNTAITSGTAKVRELLEAGLTVGLGTDVSGGYSPSILEEVRQAILVSRHVAMDHGDPAKLSTEESLYLATRGGARVVGLEDKIGGFDVGMDWDAQMISLGSVPEDGEMGELEGPVDIFLQESFADRVNKWVYNGDDRNTTSVWVKGRLVHRKN